MFNMVKKTLSFYDRVAPILLVVVIALAFAVGVLWQKVSDLSKSTTPRVANTGGTDTVTAPQAPSSGKLEASQAEKLAKVTDADHIRGSVNADVVLIEYSDFECPFCASFHPTAQQAMDEYGNRIAWVYRHFPLDSIHPKARPAANAAECIAELAGKDAFWRFADEVFGAQQTALADLSATAVKLGVNKTAFDTCFNALKHESLVDEDYQSGITAGVTGTPGNFILNKKGEVWLLPGAVPYDSLKAAIEEALAS